MKRGCESTSEHPHGVFWGVIKAGVIPYATQDNTTTQGNTPPAE